MSRAYLKMTCTLTLAIDNENSGCSAFREDEIKEKLLVLGQREAACDSLERALEKREAQYSSRQGALHESLSNVLGESEATWLQCITTAAGMDAVDVLAEIRAHREKARLAEREASRILHRAKELEKQAKLRESQLDRLQQDVEKKESLVTSLSKGLDDKERFVISE